MNGEEPNRQQRRFGALHGLLAAWCAALLVTGIVNAGEAWGAVCLGAGAVGVIAVVLGAVLRSWMTATYGVLVATAVGMLVAGGVLVSIPLLAAGVLGLMLAAAGASVVLAVRELEGGRAPSASAAAREDRALLHSIHEHTMLSDSAKRVLFRERELGLLRDAIEADIHAGKHDAAVALCEEMGSVFGYVQEAEAFRARINEARRQHYETEARAAMDHLDELLRARNWALVHQEAARIRRLYGDSHVVADLDRRIMQRRDEHKSELQASFLQAAKHEDVETAMDLLKDLDRYLSTEEAERLSEVAQGVVSKHRENLSVQFKLAVNDRRWAEAVGIGESIMREFPNSKMAEEVRSMVDLLQTRATQAAVTSSGGG